MIKKKLGRGLDELFGEGFNEEGKIVEIDVKSIAPNPWQPRREFDEESLEALARSIREQGILQPITVRRKGESYEIVAGERRLRAAVLASLEKVPCIIQTFDDRAMKEVALIENLQREDLNPVEEGLAYQSLMGEYDLTQEELGEKVGKSRSYIANALRLISLPEEVLILLREKKLTAGQARPLLSLSTKAEQIALARRIVEEGLSARAIEQWVSGKKAEKPKKKEKDPSVDAYLQTMERELGVAVGSKVKIQLGKGRNSHKGTISISFENDNEFQRITDILNQRN